MLFSSFVATNKALYDDSGIDVMFSGSTCVSCLIVGNKIFCANTGDSRAVIAREVDGSKTFFLILELQGFPLNRDHKADEEDENKRILSMGGRVEPFRDS